MKTNLLCLSALLVGSFSITACTPRDVEVTTAEERAFIKSRKAREVVTQKTAGGAPSFNEKTELRIEDKVVGVLLAEKHAEVVEMILATDLARFEKSPRFEMVVKATSEGLVKGVVTLNEKPYAIASSEALSLVNKGNFRFEKHMELINDKKQTVYLEASQKIQSALDRAVKGDRNQPKLFANLVVEDARLTMWLLEDLKTYTVAYTGKGFINVAKDKMSAMPVQIQIKMNLTFGNQDGNEIEVSEIRSQMIVGQSKPREIRLNSSKGKALKIVSKGCVYLEGVAEVGTPSYKPGQSKASFRPWNVQFSDSEVSYEGDGFKSKNLSCEERPTVDISRLLR